MSGPYIPSLSSGYPLPWDLPGPLLTVKRPRMRKGFPFEDRFPESDSEGFSLWSELTPGTGGADGTDHGTDHAPAIRRIDPL